MIVSDLMIKFDEDQLMLPVVFIDLVLSGVISSNFSHSLGIKENSSFSPSEMAHAQLPGDLAADSRVVQRVPIYAIRPILMSGLLACLEHIVDPAAVAEFDLVLSIRPIIALRPII